MNPLPPQDCLYTILYAPRERLDELIDRFVRPIALEVRLDSRLDSLFFVRYSEPRWQLRFRILARSDWVQGALKDLVATRLEEVGGACGVEEHLTTRYDREYDRYGGETGMALAERLFHLDSMMGLEIVHLDRSGRLRKSRREFAMVVVERFLDLARLDEPERIRFYRYGYAWALEQGVWEREELDRLEERFRELRPGLERLLFEADPGDVNRLYGGPEAARVAVDFIEGARPVVEEIMSGQRQGRLRQDLHHLLWSYAHMMTNRLGVESTPEAILRFFMCRLLEERAGGATGVS